MTRWAIYARYSSENQNERSIDDQVRLCREHVTRSGGEVVEVYADYAMSGAHLRSRPNAVRLLNDAAGGRFDAVMSEALDRLSRDIEDTSHLFKRLQFAGVKLVTAAEGEVGEMHVGLAGTMNALFLKGLAAKIRRGQEGRALKGFSPGGLGYGYRVVRTLDSRGEPVNGQREIVLEEAETIRRIFREYVSGASGRMIATGLNRDRIPAPAGGIWRASAINGNKARGVGILWNQAYIGFLVYNRVRMVKDPASGKRISRINPAESWVVTEMPAWRIVDDDIWNAAQAVKERFSGLSINKSVRPKHALSGLVRCGCCGGAYTIKTKDVLGCSTHKEAGACQNGRTIRMPVLEQRIFEALQRELERPEVIATYVTEYHAERKRLAGDAIAKRAKAEGRMAAINKRIANLVDLAAEGFGTDAVKAELMKLEGEKRTLATEMASEGRQDNVVELHPAALDRFRQQLSDLQAAIHGEDLLNTEAAAILRRQVVKVEVHPGAARGETSLRFQWAILETLSLPKGLRPGEAYVSRKDCRDGSGRGT